MRSSAVGVNEDMMEIDKVIKPRTNFTGGALRHVVPANAAALKAKKESLTMSMMNLSSSGGGYRLFKSNESSSNVGSEAGRNHSSIVISRQFSILSPRGKGISNIGYEKPGGMAGAK